MKSETKKLNILQDNVDSLPVGMTPKPMQKYRYVLTKFCLLGPLRTVIRPY